jgi:hypothetical protein
MEKKHLVRLELGLRQLFARIPLGPGDSLCILPLRDESVADITVFGDNNVVTELTPKRLKIIL